MHPILWLLSTCLVCGGFLIYRHYSYSTLCIHLAYQLRRLTIWLIKEAKSSDNWQEKTKKKAAGKLMDIEDNYFQMVVKLEE